MGSISDFVNLKQELDEQEVMAKPNILCHFAKGIGEPRYVPITSWPDLNVILTDALTTYNELNAAMNLVLFEDAMAHICRFVVIFHLFINVILSININYQ